ncbi:MAG: hypothetical protein ACR2NM_10765 [Bythopirellula sp.]
MTSGLATTFETLAASRNEAANPVLLAALESNDSAVSDGALKTIIARRNKAGHLAILKRWHTLAAPQRDFLQEGRGRMSGALRDAVLSDNDQLFANACEIVEQFKEYDLVATLVTLAENQKSQHAEAATDLVLKLVQQLSEMLLGPRDYDDRRNPESLSRFVSEALERSVERFRTHKRSELIEAFVILAGPTSSVLCQILDEPHHPCYLTVIDTLTHSRSAGVIDFLLRTLQAEHASLNLLNVISKRDDAEFIGGMLDSLGDPIPTKTVKNLGRIRSFAWLSTEENGYLHFEEEYQASCIKLVATSGVKTDELLDMLENILKQGTSTARWAACEALASIPGDRGNHLVLDAIEDSDPQVQAAATRQIRDRHVPGAMGILLRKIDSPYEEVREATCEALSEFSFENFLVGFEGLTEDARLSTGALVKKVDPETVSGLLSEMDEDSRKRRLRAIEMADVMELVPQVSEGLLYLLVDDDHLVRASAADALQFCPTAEVQEALRRAANDQSGAVQNAAKSTLEVFDELNRKTNGGNTRSAEGQT